MGGDMLEHRQLINGYTTEGSGIPSPTTVNGISGGGALWALTPSMMKCWLLPSAVGLVQSSTTVLSSWAQDHVMSRGQHFTKHLFSLLLFHSTSSIWLRTLNLGGDDIEHLFRAHHHNHHELALSAACCDRKVLWQRLCVDSKVFRRQLGI